MCRRTIGAGICDKWFGQCVPEVREVVKTVNGQMLADLAEAVGHADAAAVELLRQGAPLYGNLENCGLGVPRDVTPAKAIEALHGPRYSEKA